jgi:hypothetical protein
MESHELDLSGKSTGEKQAENQKHLTGIHHYHRIGQISRVLPLKRQFGWLSSAAQSSSFWYHVWSGLVANTCYFDTSIQVDLTDAVQANLATPLQATLLKYEPFPEFLLTR